jgi:hypothetical protein
LKGWRHVAAPQASPQRRKEHRYWSIVENRRVSGGRTVQRHVLYLGEINDGQRAAWCQTIETLDEGRPANRSRCSPRIVRRRSNSHFDFPTDG